MAALTQAFDSREGCRLFTVFDGNGQLSNTDGRQLLMVNDRCHANDDGPWLQQILENLGGGLCQERVPFIAQISTKLGAASVFCEPIPPPIQLCVFGGGEDAARLLDCARALEWQTVLCDKRTELFNRRNGLNADRVCETAPGNLPENLLDDLRTAAVVMTHHFSDDISILSSLLQRNIGYIGVIGGRERNKKLRLELEKVVAPERVRRLFAPVGLDIGASAPEEIAISITAEIMAFMNQRTASHLSLRRRSIRAPIKRIFDSIDPETTLRRHILVEQEV